MPLLSVGENAKAEASRKKILPKVPFARKYLWVAGKELFEMLKGRNEEREKIAEIKKSYIFYLTRHLRPPEQGLIDAEKYVPLIFNQRWQWRNSRRNTVVASRAVLAKFYASDAIW